MLSRKRAVVTVLFSDLGDSFALQLNFRNFRNFRKSCFAVFRQVSQIVFGKFRKYEFRKVSQIRVFASFSKYKFRKVSQIGFSFRKFVSQVFASFARFLQ